MNINTISNKVFQTNKKMQSHFKIICLFCNWKSGFIIFYWRKKKYLFVLPSKLEISFQIHVFE